MPYKFLFLPGNEQGSVRPQASQELKALNFSTFNEDSYTWASVGYENMSGNLSVYVTYFMANATTGNVVWSASIAKINQALNLPESDIFVNDYFTISPVSENAGQFTKAIINLSNVEVNEGDYFKLRIKRLSKNTEDTAFGDAQFLAAELKL
jgi:hypothetical protein